ncbi:MAG: alternative ribosome rescue aminoacyl-tRNA hydrolase ArfB [Myxococcales bacterium]|nr:alternative ribosome rescue aminoacyl-tRNA hydrolase ArfB [Myxococcales bacterium]MDH3482764.1 alternative ribosome rescue aminoacyl-tRNA hydrolase ArfB [Myxococcales bacterium]
MAAARDNKDLVVDERVTIPGSDLSWSASRSSGPGGQNVNKVATKVTLRFDLRGTDALSRAQKSRLRKLAGRRLDAAGGVLVSAQVERSQRQNLARAREGLRRLILKALPTPKRRVATKPTRAAKRRRLEDKRQRSQRKRSRARVSQDHD